MRRVLLLFAVPDGAGAMRMMFQFAMAFKRHGYDVCLAHGDSTAKSTGIPAAAQEMLCQLAEAGIRCLPCSGFRMRSSRSLSKRLRAIVEDQNSQVLIGFHPLDFKYALLIAGQMKRACVLSLQNRQVFWGSYFARWIKALIFRRWLRQYATRVVCTSAAVRDHLILEYQANPELCRVIPNGIPVRDIVVDDVNVSRIRQSLRSGPDDILLVNTGRIDIQKGQDLLLSALESVNAHQWSLVLIGDVSEGRDTPEQIRFQEKLDSLISRNQWEARVHFVGWRDDVDVFLTAADIYIHTARWEGPSLPLAVMEAMAWKLPIIMTDCCGRPEGFIDGVHGYVAQSENERSISQAVVKMLTHSSAERQAMGIRCREMVEANYEIGHISTRFVEEVDSVLAGL
jgi:glycosyltransferase involved in cell wall biosynthesis